MTTTAETMTGEEIVELCRRHTLFEWSAQAAVDPIPVARSKGIYFWTPEEDSRDSRHQRTGCNTEPGAVATGPAR